MRKINGFIKKNYKIVIGVLIGIIISALAVYGEEVVVVFKSKDVTYYNKDSGLASDNMQGAIDELNTKATTKINEITNRLNDITNNKLTTYRWGLPNSNSDIDYKNVGKNHFIQKMGNQLSVCIYENSSLSCFKNNNFEEEKGHLVEVFGESKCADEENNQRKSCNNGDFQCDAYSNGDVVCYGNSTGGNCWLKSNNDVRCCEPQYDPYGGVHTHCFENDRETFS